MRPDEFLVRELQQGGVAVYRAHKYQSQIVKGLEYWLEFYGIFDKLILSPSSPDVTHKPRASSKQKLAR